MVVVCCLLLVDKCCLLVVCCLLYLLKVLNHMYVSEILRHMNKIMLHLFFHQSTILKDYVNLALITDFENIRYKI